MGKKMGNNMGAYGKEDRNNMGKKMGNNMGAYGKDV